MSKPQFITAVFQITDRDAAQAFLSQILQAFASEDGDLIPGVIVTGISREDEMSRVEQLENQLQEIEA